MDLYEKISILGPSAKYDTCGPKDFGKVTNIPGVYYAKVSGTHICRLFKVLQTNTCVNNCKYCAFRRDRSQKRVTATPDEMAMAFHSAYSRHLVDGLFLSSGVYGNPDTTMTHMLDTAFILRNRYHYPGYLHLKIMPGASVSTISESIKLASRISLNIESPTEADLLQLSPNKKLKKGFFSTLFLIKKELKNYYFTGKKTPSLTTQFVVGAGEEKDRDIIKMTHFLYKTFKFSRVFYLAFRPVPNTPLSEKPAASLIREHRLYQADFLMRFYRFSHRDIPLDEDGFLIETNDPKALWAEKHPEVFPISLNKASYWNLLKVPGIGPLSAKKIIQIREQDKIRSFSQLAGFRFQMNKLSPFVYL